ncbi:MAG: hypothetical protein ACRC80_32250 [Waterburya sp.]
MIFRRLGYAVANPTKPYAVLGFILQPNLLDFINKPVVPQQLAHSIINRLARSA